MKLSLYIRVLIAACLAHMIPALALAQPAVTGLEVTVKSGGVEEITLTTSESIKPHRMFVLENPNRAVVDLPFSDTKALALPADYQRTLIKTLRAGQFDTGTSRIVFDLSGPASIALTSASDTKLVIALTPTGSGSSPFAALDEQKQTPVIPEKKKPLIVIDAGHGGQDPGALARKGTEEKDITLSYAKALKEMLLRTGRYRVALTREDDTFLKLGERVNIARRLKANAFISLHADSNPNKSANGISFYSLSERASDAEAAALAEHENKADIIDGIDLGVADEDVASILIDLTQRETMHKSDALADTLMQAMHPKILKLPKPHRFAGFRVLKAPDIPSVLIELGFLSNSKDEQLLASPEYRGLITSSIVKGLDRHFEEQKP